MYKLVKFSYKDLEGVRIFETSGLNTWNDYIKDAKDFNYPYQTYHGNDFMQFEKFEDFKESFEIQDITRSDVDTIYRLGLENMGQFPIY